MTAATTARRQATPSLHALVDAAYHADPADRLIAPVGNGSYSTLFNLIPTILAVLREAAGIEPDPRAMEHWYRHVPIAELGYLTAEQLVAIGRTTAVIAFLRSVRSGTRD